MNILVTGAAGFIGSHLSERLLTLGHNVCGIDSFTDYYTKSLKHLNAKQIQKKGVKLLPLDLAQDNLDSAVKNIQVIYHLAAQPGISIKTGFDMYLRNNILATHRLLEAVKQSAALKGFINISSSSVYGISATGNESTEPKPASYYGVTKLTAEQLALAFARDQGIPACSLRLFSVYGPRERPEKLYPMLIASILEKKTFPLYRGSQHHQRSYTYVSDVVDGMIAVLTRFNRCVGEIFNIGAHATCTTAEAIKIVENIIGKPANIRFKPKRPGDQMKTNANIEKAQRILGYKPMTTLKSGLKEEVKWYKKCILGKIDLWRQ